MKKNFVHYAKNTICIFALMIVVYGIIYNYYRNYGEILLERWSPLVLMFLYILAGIIIGMLLIEFFSKEKIPKAWIISISVCLVVFSLSAKLYYSFVRPLSLITWYIPHGICVIMEFAHIAQIVLGIWIVILIKNIMKKI